MPLIIIVVIVIALVWWMKSERALSLNERLYLRRRGYATDDPVQPAAAVAKDSRLLDLVESLGDLSPFARKRAAEDLARMCEAGERDARALPSLMKALNDSDASVRIAVASALGNLGKSEAIEALERRLDIDESALVRRAIEKAIERLKGGREKPDNIASQSK
jgi:HEAT repeat protein